MLHLEEQIQTTLAPNLPSTAFKQKLHRELVDMARQRKNQEVLLAPPPPNRWLVGAAIGSVMALASGIAYVLHLRGEEHSRQAVEAES